MDAATSTSEWTTSFDNYIHADPQGIFQRFPLNNDQSTFAALEIDERNSINLTIHSIVTRYDPKNDVTQSATKSEWRVFKYNYHSFLEKILPYLIRGGHLMRTHNVTDTILLNERFANGLVLQVLMSPNGHVSLDLR